MKKTLSRLLMCATVLLASCQEIDKSIPVSGITLNKTELLMVKESKEMLTATVAPENATNKELTWESSDPNVATVSESGEVTALKEGTALITVTSVADNTQNATCKVTVAIFPSSVTLNKINLLLSVGGKETLTATVAPENATNKEITWESNDPSVATVSESGEVTALMKGEATITVTTENGKKTASCAVVVFDETMARCQVVNNVTPVTSTIGADGTMYDAKVIFYNATTEVGATSIGEVSPSGGQSPIILLLEGATKARVSFKLIPTLGDEYTADYFALSENALTVITLTDNTMLASKKDLTKGIPETITLREALSRL